MLINNWVLVIVMVCAGFCVGTVAGVGLAFDYLRRQKIKRLKERHRAR